jgi:hypothetical protein
MCYAVTTGGNTVRGLFSKGTYCLAYTRIRVNTDRVSGLVQASLGARSTMDSC